MSAKKKMKVMRRWNEWETREFLLAVAAKIKRSPGSFMKPTAYRFFRNVCKSTPIEHLFDELGPELLRSKMRRLQMSYEKAVEIILEENKEHATADAAENVYVRKVCPFYEILKPIFDLVNEQHEYIPEEADLEPDEQNTNDQEISDDEDYWTPFTQQQKVIENVFVEEVTQESNARPANQTQESQDSVNVLLEQKNLYEERLRLERARLQVARDRLQLERDKLAFEKYKLDEEIELQRHEIDLKYKNARFEEFFQ